MASFCSKPRYRLLEAVASANNNSTICEALVAQQSAFIDTGLNNIFLSEVDAFDTNGQTLNPLKGVLDAGIEL